MMLNRIIEHHQQNRSFAGVSLMHSTILTCAVVAVVALKKIIANLIIVGVIAMKIKC